MHNYEINFTYRNFKIITSLPELGQGSTKSQKPKRFFLDSRFRENDRVENFGFPCVSHVCHSRLDRESRIVPFVANIFIKVAAKPPNSKHRNFNVVAGGGDPGSAIIDRGYSLKLPRFAGPNLRKIIITLAVAGMLSAVACEAAEDTNSSASVVPPVAVQADPYYAEWGGWELKPLEKARKQAELIYKSDFSPAGLARWWLPDGVTVQAREQGVAVALAPEAESAGMKWGVLWFKTPVFAPFAAEVEFTLDPTCPHDANLFWGQNVLSKEKLGREQECYLAGFFGWGGKSCGLERASDWQTFGITGAVDPKPGVKRTAVWIVEGRLQCMYLDGTLVLYARLPERPPASGYFGLGVYMSRVIYHSVKVFRLNPRK